VTPSQPLETPLWTFSLAVYGSDGVADECLDLQERLGLDVNILLFAAFIGAVEGVRLDVSDITAANAEVAHWQDDIVRPLRKVRRALKSADAEVLRAQVKTAELEAEKIEQRLLWQWSRQLAGRPRGDRAQALAANLYRLLEFYDAVGVQAYATAALPRLLAAATAYRP
jgi:uncharacterized protein (TIGR02444 family)